jgi:tetratricopeptide (TPR) repeat protein
VTQPPDTGDQQPLDPNDPVFIFITGVAAVLEDADDLDPNELKRRIDDVVAAYPEPPRALGRTPQQQASEIMEAAWEDPDGTRSALNALRLDNNCTDAWVYLGYDAGDELELAFVFFTLALMAGFATLGQEMFDEHAGEFWIVEETRPFMRALEAVARTNWDLGEDEAAATYFEEMLRLNPADSQGARYPLMWVSLERGDHDTVRGLLAEYADDDSAPFLYGAALVAFQEGGDTSAARNALARAASANPHVVKYLTGTPLPDFAPDSFQDGGEEEAVVFSALMVEGWTKTPGALDWLKQVTSNAAPSPAPKPPAKERRSGPRAIE